MVHYLMTQTRPLAVASAVLKALKEEIGRRQRQPIGILKEAVKRFRRFQVCGDE